MTKFAHTKKINKMYSKIYLHIYAVYGFFKDETIMISYHTTFSLLHICAHCHQVSKYSTVLLFAEGSLDQFQNKLSLEPLLAISFAGDTETNVIYTIDF